MSAAAPLEPSHAALVDALASHYDELVRYVRQRFVGRGFARDVVHDVCVQILEAPPQQPVHTPLAFLRRVSMHRAIDRSRADAARNALVEPVAVLPDTLADRHDGASALDFAQQVQALVCIVETMPPRARQVFLLHRIHGMAHEEIAAAIGVTRSMVSHHFARAMRDIESRWAPALQWQSRPGKGPSRRRREGTCAVPA